MKLRSFLDKYDTVIFDLDGVITSEEAYWDTAALTVYEFLNDIRYFGNDKIDVTWCMNNIKQLRDEVFFHDKTIMQLKNAGVNSNWDLGYVVVCLALINDTCDYEKIYGYTCGFSDSILDIYELLAEKLAEKKGLPQEKVRRGGELWWEMQLCFQEWFLGEELFTETYHTGPINRGKQGLLYNEKPIIPMDDLKNVLRLLAETKRVCTGTGRPYIEASRPFEMWDVRKYFAADGFSNYDHVNAAEKNLKMTLTKPHPYMFLKAVYGTDYDDEKLISGDYDKAKIKGALVVGDAGADILAAHAMGADFCAVLTGIAGEKARGYFEEQNAEYILGSVADFLE